MSNNLFTLPSPFYGRWSIFLVFPYCCKLSLSLNIFTTFNNINKITEKTLMHYDKHFCHQENSPRIFLLLKHILTKTNELSEWLCILLHACCRIFFLTALFLLYLQCQYKITLYIPGPPRHFSTIKKGPTPEKRKKPSPPPTFSAHFSLSPLHPKTFGVGSPKKQEGKERKTPS